VEWVLILIAASVLRAGDCDFRALRGFKRYVRVVVPVFVFFCAIISLLAEVIPAFGDMRL
jgi:hypothetical protein